jgi:hypothetical protein
VKTQALIDVNGGPYDVLPLSNNKGQRQTVYFDISNFFGKEPSGTEIQVAKRR